MKKLGIFIVTIAIVFTACKPKESLVVEDYPIVDPCPETSISIDYELKDVESGKVLTLTYQSIPKSPIDTVQPGDTIRICKSYGDSTWHVEEYYDGWSEVDDCEKMSYGVILSFKRITYQYVN